MAEAEFEIPGGIVVDIAVSRGPSRQADGAVLIDIEALTIEE